jgi:hypothetical protein
MKFPIITRFLVLTCLTLLAAGGLRDAAGEEGRFLYQWTDDKGNVGLADDLTKVPEQYRSRAKRLQQPGASDPGQDAREMRQQQAAPDEGQDRGAGYDADDLKKAEWQQRIHDAKMRQEAAERKLNELEQRKAAIKSQWGAGGAALPPQSVLDEVARIESDMASARRDAEKAREEINVTIPDQARKAGIPPGWLREVQ